LSGIDYLDIVRLYDQDLGDYLSSLDQDLLELEGVTRVNPLSFRDRYWSEPVQDLTIDPNANIGNHRKSYIRLMHEVTAPVNKLRTYQQIRRYGNKLGFNGDRLVRDVVEGRLYVHNSITFCDLVYCIGLPTKHILDQGLNIANLPSKPPTRPSSFINLVIRMCMYAANMFAGAVALTDLFPAYSAYTIERSDYSDYNRINDFQNLVHGVNDMERANHQSPFTNVNIQSPDTMRSIFNVENGDPVLFRGYSIDDLMDEIIYNQMLYLDFMSKGTPDNNGGYLGIPYRFPVTTLVADRSWSREYPDEWYRVLSLNKDLCFLNLFNNYHRNLKQISSCCRLFSDLDLLGLNANNTFGSYLSVGSHGVVTINLPRIAYETRDQDRFLEVLEERMEEARQILFIQRTQFLKHKVKHNYFFSIGLLDLDKHFFSTIGFHGLPEALEILGMDIMDQDGLRFAKTVLMTLKQLSLQYSVKDGYMYNIEEVPAEGATNILATKDRMMCGGTYNFYSNQLVPLYRDVPMVERARVEGELQPLITGGTIAHFNIMGWMDDESSFKLHSKMLENTRVVYFAFNRGFTICRNGHNTMGVYDKCPECGSRDLDWITRVVGYFVPYSDWSRLRQLEFKTRQWSSI